MRRLLSLLLSLVLILGVPLASLAEEPAPPAVEEPAPAPVEPPTDPVEPPTDPVEPPTDPVDPPTDPVDPPTDPVDPPTDPVDPPTDPVDPPTDPVDPPTDPVDPPTDPVDPPTDPVDPPTDPVDPTEEPTPDPLAIWFAFEEDEEEEVELYVGEKLFFPYELSDAVAQTNPEVLWSSADEDIATVTEKEGEILAIAKGEVEITATLPSGESASFLLVVLEKDPSPTEPEETPGTDPSEEPTPEESPSTEPSPDPTPAPVWLFTLSAQRMELLVGEARFVEYALTQEGANTLEADPTISTLEAESAPVPPAVLWTSENEAVATVDTLGVITALATGETLITATVEGMEPQQMLLTVTEPAPELVTVMRAGDITDPFALIAPLELGLDRGNTQWISHNEEHAMVLADGQIMAVLPGSVIVDAISGGQKAYSIQVDVLPALVNANSGTMQGGRLTWNVSGGVLTISGNDIMPSFTQGNRPWAEHLSSITTVVLSGPYDIGTWAFSGMTALTNIDIPASVRDIGSFAFSGCTALRTITVPSSVTRIERKTFSGCSALSTVHLPATLQEIESQAFEYCTSLGVIQIPNGVSSMGTEVFSGCTALTTVYLPTALTVIPDHLFEGCTALPNLTFPPNTTRVGNSVFQGCTSLTNVLIPPTTTSLGNNVFAGCTALRQQSIPASVTSVGTGLFKNCTSLTDMYADGLTVIEDDMFNGCTSLTRLPIYTQVNHIGDRAFQGCTALSAISIPSNVQTLGTNVFDGCTKLFDVTLLGSLGRINAYMFNGCTGLTKITLPEGITSIDQNAFYRSGLTEINFPTSLTTIGRQAFDGAALQTVSISGTITSIGESAFANCSQLTRVSLPGGMTALTARMFFNCPALTQITLPGTITSIGESVFENCTGLSQIYLPSSLTTLGKNAFYDCVNLVTVVYPEGFTTIGQDAFRGCVKLAMPDFPSTLQRIEPGAFYGCTAISNLVLPRNLTFMGDNAFGDIPLHFVVFEGNAPQMGANVFSTVKQIKYLRGRANFTVPTWYKSFPCKSMIDPRPFVTNIFTVAFGRAPTDDEVYRWSKNIYFEEITGAGLAEGFLLGTEFMSRPTTDTQFIQALYSACFNRTPAANEVTAWLNDLNGGVTRRGAVIAIVNNGKEFATLCNDLSLVKGTLSSNNPADLNPGVAGFVTRMYTILLQRNPAEREVNAWVDALLKGQHTGTSAVRGAVIDSPEFTNIQMSDAEYIRRLFKVLIDREPSAEEVSRWLSDMIGLGGRVPAFATFCTAKEFIAVMGKYGVKP